MKYSRKITQEKADVLRLAQILIQRQSGVLKDSEVLAAVDALEVWAADMPYGKDQAIMHNGVCYRVVQDVPKSQAHQPPDATGMLAVYRPIDNGGSDGTKENPIPFVYGMDCTTGKYFTYEGKLWLCKGDMLPCVYPPGTAGLWQWELVKEELTARG